MGIIDRIQAKIELFRLEKRYTRRRHRRSTFQSNAVYVDGEYIYQTPATTGSSNYSSSASTSASNYRSATVGASVGATHTNALHFEPSLPVSPDLPSASSAASHSSTFAEQQRVKRANRMSMPVFGNTWISFERPVAKSAESQW